MPKPNTLLCTIGVSLFYPNLSNLAKETQTDPILCKLAAAYSAAVKERERRINEKSECRVPDREWEKLGTLLHPVQPTDRLCGAEINSVTDLVGQGSIEHDRLHLFHSDTDDGEAIAKVLESYFTRTFRNVNIHRVEGLRDDAPDKFRTQGLRNLAKLFGEQVREARREHRLCAINATGGYKAQIAIAVLMGQALDIPVYYKHERFNAIIPFPPMPVALDFSLWERASGMFTVLAKGDACEPWERFKDDWDERFEPLVNRVPMDDGKDYLELSATGQIFHETFRSRFQELKATNLPLKAKPDQKETPKLGDHAYNQARKPIIRFLEKVTELPYVRYCHTTYWNPDLPESTRFRMSDGEIQGIYSNKSWCVKFRVVTTATTQDQLPVVVADLNDWLDT
ncbi:MAG: putative CRISPR-associated protein [Candidatus Poribacteria bacterium]|nr:putative CRISPR-associated protein [Candidatus Poribacteria bacterium]